MRLVSYWNQLFLNSGTEYNIDKRTIYIILYYPVLLTLLFSFLLVFHPTRSITKWVLLENRPVELMTFIAFFLASIAGIVLIIKMKNTGENLTVLVFFGLFAFASFLVGMEEIAWGQWLIGFETPANWKAMNIQGETTLHNLPGLHGWSEVPQTFFGLAGIVGIWLSEKKYFPHVHVPLILIVSFVVIAFMAGFDLLTDNLQISTIPILDWLFGQIDELTELIIAMTCFLFIWLNLRRIKKPRQQS